MQQALKIVRGFASPAILLIAVWCVILIGVAVGPIDYPQQPSMAVLALVGTGVLLFVSGSRAGAWCFAVWLRRRPNLRAAPVGMLNVAVATSSLLGLAGVALIALDRAVLSGNGGFAELLRCAPALVDFIEIKRTPLLYVGYLTFSFGFASLVLFLLRGEEIRGWVAILAQLSIFSPVGYAILYSGRMPILFIIVLIVGVVLVRLAEGRRPLPRGHHLLVKMVVVFLLFGAYSSAMWSSRQAFCVQMSGLIVQLQQRMNERDLARARIVQPRPTEATNPASPGAQRSQPAGGAGIDGERKTSTAPSMPPAADTRNSADSVSTADLNKMVDETKATPGSAQQGYSPDVVTLLAVMQEAWHVRPRGYVLSAIESGRLSPGVAVSLLSTYFYLTHGVRIMDMTWRARAQFSPQWGTYEIGIFSPILRVFFPQNQLLASMNSQLRSAGLFGFFPTVWAAAFIDFGLAGAVIYVLIWGFAAGWSAYGARHSALATPPLLLTFALASILLSPVQGPLGIANSAMVLVSMVIVGMAVDLPGLRAGYGRQPRQLKAGTPA